jgi:hypothetical protein
MTDSKAMRALAKSTLVTVLLAVFAVQVNAITRKFRLYNVATGEKINAAFKFKWSSMSGQVVATLPSGENLEGEFNTGHSGSATWGQIYSSNGESASGSAITITGTQGSLILTGKSGFTIQCEYVTNTTTTHGNGACIDNHSGHYRLMF